MYVFVLLIYLFPLKGREKEIMIPQAEESMTITKTVTTIEREEHAIAQQVRPNFVAPLEPEIYVRERGIARYFLFLRFSSINQYLSQYTKRMMYKIDLITNF